MIELEKDRTIVARCLFECLRLTSIECSKIENDLLENLDE